MSKPEDFPTIPEALLKKLEALYPERCPEPDWPTRKVWMRAGERNVVRFLARVYREQNERPVDVFSRT
jgi:hypothetical protein